MYSSNKEIQIIEWKDLNKVKFLLLNPTAFFCIRFILYPSIVVKTRLQVQTHNYLYKNSIDAFYKIVKTDGLKGLYKGYLISSLGIISGQFYIITYEFVRAQLEYLSAGTKSFIAGGAASLVGQTVTVPIDILSQYRMIQGGDMVNQPSVRYISHQPLSSLQIARHILKDNGVLGFYRGYLASIMTYAPSSAIWWYSYNTVLPLFNTLLLYYTVPIPLLQAMSGAISSISSSVLTNPIDVIRTRLQVGSNRGIIGETAYLLNTEGVMSLSKGLTARLMFTVPFSILIIVTYEFLKQICTIK